jgi:hypothetical protein
MMRLFLKSFSLIGLYIALFFILLNFTESIPRLGLTNEFLLQSGYYNQYGEDTIFSTDIHVLIGCIYFSLVPLIEMFWEWEWTKNIRSIA